MQRVWWGGVRLPTSWPSTGSSSHIIQPVSTSYTSRLDWLTRQRLPSSAGDMVEISCLAWQWCWSVMYCVVVWCEVSAGCCWVGGSGGRGRMCRGERGGQRGPEPVLSCSPDGSVRYRNKQEQLVTTTTTTTRAAVVRLGGYIGRQCPSRSEWGEKWLVRRVRVVNSPTFWPESSQETLRPHQSQTTACSYQRTVIWASKIQITRHLVINSPGLTDPLHNLGSQTFFSWNKNNFQLYNVLTFEKAKHRNVSCWCEL